MNKRNKRMLLSLQFIPFVLTNGMNLFPILIFAHLFLTHRDISHYVLPLILYYSFKTTILFLVRIKPIRASRLLQLSILIGIIGSFLGVFYEGNFYFGLIAGAMLGICSGLLYPSFLTVQLHEKTMNNFGTSKNDQFYSIGFALIFSVILFHLINYSIPLTFAFLGLNLMLLLIIVSVYPHYEIEEEIEYPNYPVIESLFLFSVGFFSIFIIKGEKKLGVANLLPVFFLFLVVMVIIYLVYLMKIKPERRLSPFLTQTIIFKGMLTNFILVFTTFNQLIRVGGKSLYVIYSLYLLAIIISPIIKKMLSKKYTEPSQIKIIRWGVISGLILVLWPTSYYLGVFLISLFSSQLNQQLNQYVYLNAELPKDFRLMAKFRLNNLGSIFHQIIMMLIIYLVTVAFKTVTVDEIFMSYSYKQVDKSAFFTLDVTKWILVAFFVLFISILEKQYQRKKTL